MMGFKGTFAVNFVRLRRMPDYIGLGKSVSRGFGTVLRFRKERVEERL